MKYSYIKIQPEVKAIVKKACYSKQNIFKSTIWQYHIMPVVEHSMRLGRKLKADLEILELAALLHDYASTIGRGKYYREHHSQSAKMAVKILKRLNYPAARIERVKECIISHRGSVKIKPKTLEAKILASADAMSHITELADMLYLAYNVHNLETSAGAKWLKNKLKRSWGKIMPAGKKIVSNGYKLFMKILDNTIKKSRDL